MKRLFTMLFSSIVLGTLLCQIASAYVIPESDLKPYALNGIIFYNNCKMQSNNSGGAGSSCAGTLEGKNNEERVWNYFVEANIDGVSNNPAAIAGIMGNLKQETDFGPFVVTGQWYGIFQTQKENMKVIDDAGLGQYWGGNSAPEDAEKKAITLELDWLTQKHERFLGTGEWEGKGFMSFVNDVSEKTPEAYADLFLVTVEDAITDSVNSSQEGSNKIEEKAAKNASKKIYNRERYYQEAEVRRKYAKEIYDKYSDSGVCLSGIPAFNGKEVTWQDLNPLSSNDRLALLTETYGPFAMQLQKYYGIPWELPFAVMVFESQVGAGDPGDISHQAQADGNYNMMGLTDTVVGYDDKYRIDPRVCYYNSDGQCHSGYASISQMILGYAIYHARSGNSYDEGLKALSLENYDLTAALSGLMHDYCGSTESNTYCGDGGPIAGVIRTGSAEWSGILDTIKKNGWKNSEELAKAWNIQPGGLATQQWGWGDIRDKIWNAYGVAGLPANASATTGATSVSASNEDSDSVSSTGALVGNAVLHKPNNEWLENAGLQGYIKDAVPLGGVSGGHIDTTAVRDGHYTDFASDAGAGSGLPGFIILHLTSADNFEARSWANFQTGPNGAYVPPHFTIDVKKREIFQHFPLTHPSAAVGSRGSMSPDKYGIQIEIVGHGGDPNGGDYATCMEGACSSEYDFKNFTKEDYEYLVSLLMAISEETGIPLKSTVTWAKNSHEAEGLMIQSDDELKKYIGVLGHTHISGKWDPLNVWEYIEPVLSGAGYNYSTADISSATGCDVKTSGSSNGLNVSAKGHCFQISSEDGGCTEDGFTWFGQSGASWAGKTYGDHSGCTNMAIAGCGPSAMAMVITALTGKLVLPDEVADKTVEVGGRPCNDGTDVIAMANGVAPMYDLKAQCVPEAEVTEQSVNKWLDEGKMAVFSVGFYETEFGQLTSSGGHVIALRGKTNDGKWLTFDSSHINDHRNNRHYKPNDILGAYRNHSDNFCLVYK